MIAKFKRVLFTLFFVVLTGCDSADFVDAQGKDINWEDFRGRWLVINYWAEWCKPCLEEIPELNSLYLAHKDKDAYVLGINFDPLEPTELNKQIDALNVQFPVLQTDRDGKLNYLHPEVLPTTYVFDHKGELRHKLVGPQTQVSIEALLQKGEG